MKYLSLTIMMLLLSVCAHGQTVVNLSVTDTPDNQSWNNGTWAVQLIPGPGNLDQTRNFSLLVAGGSLGSQSGSLSSTGTASMLLPANVNIGPVGTKWQFTVCSQQGTACSISNVTVVTSSPQTVALTPPSIRVSAAPNLPPIVVYTTTEISSASIGSQITVVGSTPSTPALQTCTAISGTTCTTWAAAGGSATKFETSGIYVATNCAGAANCFQVNDDTQVSTNAVYTSGSNQISTASTDPAFVAATDNTKIGFVEGRCSGLAAPCNYDCPQGTVTVVSAHIATLGGGNCTNTNSGTANANNFAWGHDDGPTLVTAYTALFPNAGSGSISPGLQPNKNLYLPCGIMMTSVQPFVAFAGDALHNVNGGGISGCGGTNGTVIIPLPKMNCNTGAGHGCLFDDQILHQLQVGAFLFGWHIRDLTFWGLGSNVADGAATITAGNYGIATSWYDSLDNVSVVGWLYNNGNQVKGALSNASIWTNVNIIAAGTNACTFTSSANTVASMYGGSCGGSGNVADGAIISGALTRFNSFAVYFNQDGTNNLGGTWNDYGSYINNYVKTSNAASVTNLNSTTINQQGGGTSIITISAGIIRLSQVTILASGAPINQTGGAIYDSCGNTNPLPGTAPTVTNILGDCSVTGAADVVGNHVLTSGWGTANVNTVGGATRDVRFTISVTGGTPAAGPVLTDTFATPFWITPSAGCVLTQVGGTFAVITNPLPSALTRTGVTWTFSGTPVSGQSYIFVRHCANS